MREILEIGKKKLNKIVVGKYVVHKVDMK